MENKNDTQQRVEKLLGKDCSFISWEMVMNMLCDRIEELESGKPTWMK